MNDLRQVRRYCTVYEEWTAVHPLFAEIAASPTEKDPFRNLMRWVCNACGNCHTVVATWSAVTEARCAGIRYAPPDDLARYDPPATPRTRFAAVRAAFRAVTRWRNR